MGTMETNSKEIKEKELEEKIANLNTQLEEANKKLAQYESAYKDQIEKYNKLFGLFANNIEYFISQK